MSYQQLKKRTEGFTIIEVLIVLAIAGLIMLIVFMAVPALQRNSRNTQIRNDVAVYLGAISEWSTNNNGKVPTAADLGAADGSTAGSINSYAKVSTNTVRPTALTGSGTNGATVGNIQLVVGTGAKCNGANTTSGAAPRSVAIMYAVEGSNGDVKQCQEG